MRARKAAGVARAVGRAAGFEAAAEPAAWARLATAAPLVMKAERAAIWPC